MSTQRPLTSLAKTARTVSPLASPLAGTSPGHTLLALFGAAIAASVGGLGYVSNFLPFMAISAAVGSVVVVWLNILQPATAPTLFWIAYSYQVAAAGEVIPGLYYPLYLLMAASCVAFLLAQKRELTLQPRMVLIYLGFLLLVLVGLPFSPFSISVALQRLFIFSLGLLSATQLQKRAQIGMFLWGTVSVALAVALQVISIARSTNFAFRGGGEVNENFVAIVISVGVLVLAHFLLAHFSLRRPLKTLLALCALGFLLYAFLILASRGVTISLFASITVLAISALRLKSWRGIAAAVGLGLMATMLMNLPGANGLIRRLDDGDVSTLNDRLPLWEAAVTHLSASSPLHLLFGEGMGASEAVVRSQHPGLTSMHNSYLQFAVDYGFVGVILLIALLIGAARASLRHGDAAGTINAATICFLGSASLSATLSDNFIFWVALGMALPVRRGT